MPGIGFDFVGDPPLRVGELAQALGLEPGDLLGAGEAALGSVPAIPRAGPLSAEVSGLHAGFRWDVHHERPVTSPADLADRTLTSWTAYFPGGRRDCEAALEAAYGPASAVGDRRRYGPFFVDLGGAEHFALEWHATEPDWAKPSVNLATRSLVLAALTAQVGIAATDADLDAALAALPEGVGMRAGGRTVTFEPSIPAAELLAAIGHPDAIARSVDVHMASWQVFKRSGAEPLTLGPWQLDVALDGRPTGAELPEVHTPAAGARRLGRGDAVRSITVTRRRESAR